MVQLTAVPLSTLDKPKNINPVERDGKVYLHITKNKYVGVGKTIDDAISDANARTFFTGYGVEKKG